jgi:hypothetical protein
MSMLGTIGGGSSYWPWFGAIPRAGEEKVVYGSPLSTVSSSPWLSVSEKERIEELLLSGSLVIPPPQINIAVFQNIALHFPDFFNISLVGAAGLGAFGAVECSIVLAGLGAWTNSQHDSGSDLVQALLSGQGKNPLEVALRQYINHSQSSGIDTVALQLQIRQMAALHAALKTVSPDTLMEAFLLAQQQIVITLLAKWSESQAELEKMQKESLAKAEIFNAEKARQILVNYVHNESVEHSGLKQPVLSMLLGAFFADASMTASISALIPAASLGGAEPVPQSLAIDLSILAAGVVSSTIMWAAPIAMSITSNPPGISQAQVNRDSAKAFSLSMAALINNPEFDKLLTDTLSQAVASGLITQSKAESLSATFKTSLLLVAMAVLYKADLGGVTASELRAIISGEMTIGENDFLGVLAKLVHEQLDKLDPKAQETVLDELLKPYDQSPSLDPLTSPLSCFISGWNPQCIRDSALAGHG